MDHFLARWWVNGRPYVPEGSRPGAEARYNGGLVGEGKSLHLHLDFDPAGLGARRGDRIGVQLLYVDRGRKYTGLAAQLERPRTSGDRERVLLTNRVEFTAP